MAKVNGVILDVDGTLVDTNDAHTRAYVKALDAHGFSTTFDAVRSLIGMGGDQLLPRAAGVEKKSPEGKAILESRGQFFKSEFLPHVQPFPQVRELVEHLRESGLKVIIASSGEPDEVEALLDVAHVRDLLPEIVSGEDAEKSKPEPNLVQAAIDRLGLPATEIIMVGDTPWDIEAGSKAGIAVIALRCGGYWSDEKLAGATAIYDDPSDLLAHFETAF